MLEVVVDEQRTPLWRARCLQSGKLLTVALDGLVQVPLAPHAAEGSDEDYFSERRRARGRKRWVFLAGSVGVASLAFVMRDSLASWLETLRGFLTLK